MYERLIDCLKFALENNVSDIHFSLKENIVTIEMRVNSKIKKLKSNLDDLKFFRYLQYQANIDIGDRLKPQTGRFEVKINNKIISLRFSVINCLNITSAVLRILNGHNSLKIEDLTNNIDYIKYFYSITTFRSGLYVFSGPTGSGKTTALYTILNNTKNKKIYTLEDPVEVYSENYVQLQINEKQNLNYDTGIKQLLRHDPDIIMIGEIRDTIAAQMAIRCALTGHLVITSIHASSCKGAIERLIELGVNKFQLIDVLKGVSNQRLYTFNNKKIGIYEVMDYKEVEYYFKNNRFSDKFRELKFNIKEAIEKGFINIEEACQDLYQ